MVVDSHAHFWKYPEGSKFRFDPPQEPLPVDRLVEQMDAAGVDKLVHITRSVMGFDNAFSMEGAGRYPDRIRFMGRFDLGAPNVIERLRGWLRQPYMVGIRMMTFIPEEKRWFSDERLIEPYWTEAEKLGIPIAIYAPDESRVIAGIAARHLGLKLIVDHVGMRVMGIFKSPPSTDDWPNLMALERFPNVTIKVSGLPEAMVERYPFPKSQQRLKEIYDRFGPDRMMWGSNYPPVTQIATYKEVLDYICFECQFLSDADKSRILGGTAVAVLGLPWKN